MTLAPYADYQPAPAGWIGRIPAHWHVERIKFSLSEKGKVIVSGLPAGAISYGRVVAKDGEKILPETLASYQEVRAGEFLINPINLNYDLVSLRTALSDIDVVVSPAYIVLRANEWKLDPRYGNYLLHIFDIRHMKTLGAGIRQTIGFQDIGNCRWVLPPLNEQAVIADYVDREAHRIDQLINRKIEFITLLGEKSRAITAHAITGGISGANDIDGDGPEWLGRIPARWKTVRIAELFCETVRPADPELPVLAVSIHDGVSDKELEDGDRARMVNLSEDRTKYQRVQPGDLVYNMMRAWQGAFGTVTVNGLVSPAYVVAEPKTEFRTKFIELQLRTASGAEEVRRYSKGIADFRQRLYWEHFRNLKVCLPPLKEQDDIIAHIESEQTRLALLKTKTERSIELLREHRTALITAAVTGKIDVRSAA